MYIYESFFNLSWFPRSPEVKGHWISKSITQSIQSADTQKWLEVVTTFVLLTDNKL